jgi:hypothetical protein
MFRSLRPSSEGTTTCQGLTCQSCRKVYEYIGQTDRILITRYEEHIKNIRSNNDESAFAQHILDEGHLYGPTEQIIKLIEYARKGNFMSVKENYYIYKFKQLKELTEEQTNTKDNDNRNSMFNKASRHEYTHIKNVTFLYIILHNIIADF